MNEFPPPIGAAQPAPQRRQYCHLAGRVAHVRQATWSPHRHRLAGVSADHHAEGGLGRRVVGRLAVQGGSPQLCRHNTGTLRSRPVAAPQRRATSGAILKRRRQSKPFAAQLSLSVAADRDQ